LSSSPSRLERRNRPAASRIGRIRGNEIGSAPVLDDSFQRFGPFPGICGPSVSVRARAAAILDLHEKS